MSEGEEGMVGGRQAFGQAGREIGWGMLAGAHDDGRQEGRAAGMRVATLENLSSLTQKLLPHSMRSHLYEHG